MKATLTYEFDLPEEESDLIQLAQRNRARAALEDIARGLRAKVKYGDFSQEVIDTWEAAHDLFWDTMNEYGIDPYGED